MQKRKITLLIFLLIGFGHGFAQLNVNGEGSEELISKFKMLPQEHIFLHYNTDVLFTGERFFYSVYCQNAKENSFSELSQVVYIELISENGKSILKQKVHLDEGRGSGDFFISGEQRTGSYKLLAYTNWMKNYGIASFFKTDVIIINPYQKVPVKYRMAGQDSIAKEQLNTTPFKTTSLPLPEKVVLELDKQVVEKRAPVTLGLQIKDSALVGGTYSLSISKRSDLFPDWNKSSRGVFKNRNRVGIGIKERTASFWSTVTSKEIFYLPELRGELISGRIINSKTKLPVPESTIALSIPGENYLLKIATTNKQGRFFINVDEDYGNTTAIINNLSGDWDESKLILDENQMIYNKLDFVPFKLNDDMETTIRERSVQNQIANAYDYLRLDTTLEQDTGIQFYREMRRTFNLDEFTRFKTLKETFIEVVNQVGIRRKSNGNRVFEVFTDFAREKSGLQSMLFVDGLFISEQERFMDYDAHKVKEISFSKGLYRLGPVSFDGVLAIKTIDGDFDKTFYAENQLKIALQSFERKKNYYEQRYSNTEDIAYWSRIPDFRRQLLWIPEIKLENENAIEFYTSSVSGIYDVVLQGFDKNGKLISTTTSLRVN